LFFRGLLHLLLLKVPLLALQFCLRFRLHACGVGSFLLRSGGLFGQLCL
jgi:hypothetical protein